MDDYQHLCPVCKSNGITTFLQLRQINLTTAVYLCKDIRCSYPQGHTWIYVDRKFPDDTDSDSDSSDSSVSDDIERLRIESQKTAISDLHAEHFRKDSSRDLNIARDDALETSELEILEEASKKDMIIVNSLTDIENIIVDDPNKILPVQNATNPNPIVLASGVSDSEVVDVNVAENTNESSNIEYKLELVANNASDKYKFNIQLINQKQDNKEDIQRNVSEQQYNLKKAFVCNAVDLKTGKMGNVNNKNIIRVETFKEINKIKVPDLSKVIIVSNKSKTNDLPNTDHIYCLPNIKLGVTEHTKIDSTETHINKISIKKNLYDLEKNNIKHSERPEKIQNTVNTNEDVEIIYDNVPRLQVADFGDTSQNKKKDVIKNNRSVSKNKVEKVSDKSEKIQNTVKTNKTTKIVDCNLQIVDSGETLKNCNKVKNKLPDLEENKTKLSKDSGEKQNEVETDKPVEDFDEWSFIEPSSAETSAKKNVIKTPEKLKKDHFDLILPNVKDVQDMTIKIQEPKFGVIFKSKLKLQSKKDKRHTFKFSESMIDEALKITEKETIEKSTESRSLVKSICKRTNIVGVRNKALRFEGFRYKSKIKEADKSTEAASTRELRSKIKRSSVTEQTAEEQSEENVDSASSNNSIVVIDLNVNDASSKSAINDTTNLGLGDLTINELFDNIDDMGQMNVPNNAVDIAEVDDWLTSLCQ